MNQDTRESGLSVFPVCRHCGAIMGDERRHIEWHIGTASEGEFQLLKQIFAPEIRAYAGVPS